MIECWIWGLYYGVVWSFGDFVVCWYCFVVYRYFVGWGGGYKMGFGGGELRVGRVKDGWDVYVYLVVGLGWFWVWWMSVK